MSIMLLRQPKFESLTFGAYFTVIKGMKELLGDSGHLAIKTRTINTGTLSLGLFYDTYSNSVPESTAVKTDSVAEAKHKKCVSGVQKTFTCTRKSPVGCLGIRTLNMEGFSLCSSGPLLNNIRQSFSTCCSFCQENHPLFLPGSLNSSFIVHLKCYICADVLPNFPDSTLL